MKVLIDFVYDIYYGKHVELPKEQVIPLDGESAMNMLFQQECGEHKNIVVLFKRGDLPYCAKTASSSMQVNTFASDNFEWFYVNKGVLDEKLTNNF